jgi:hypothetical protein
VDNLVENLWGMWKKDGESCGKSIAQQGIKGQGSGKSWRDRASPLWQEAHSGPKMDGSIPKFAKFTADQL